MKIVGCILAGGRSSRFGSDKALAVVGGKTLLDHVIGRLGPQVSALAVNTNSDDPVYAETGLPLVKDATQDFRGPLAGILASLEWASTVEAEAVVTAAVDTPLFPHDLVKRLSEPGKDRIAIAESQTGLHPTFGFWPVCVQAALSIWLDSDQSLRVNDFLAAQGFDKILFDAHSARDPFHNINSSSDAVIVEAITGSIRDAKRE
jgi:molybdenum cofactor guanylyltransferase